jgi:hypothetical protein
MGIFREEKQDLPVLLFNRNKTYFGRQYDRYTDVFNDADPAKAGTDKNTPSKCFFPFKRLGGYGYSAVM